MENKDLIELLKFRLKNYEENSRKLIPKDIQFIIQVGNLTVSRNNLGLTELSDENYPHQFNQKQTDKICGLRFYDDDNKRILPIIYFASAWYSERYFQTKKLICLLEESSLNEDVSNEELQEKYNYLEIQFNGMNFELDEIFTSDKESDSKYILFLVNHLKETKEKMDLIENIIYKNNQIELAKNKFKNNLIEKGGLLL